MRILCVENVKEGMKIGKPVYGDSGNLLIQRNTQINKKFIERLKELNIPSIYIDDDLSRGLLEESIIPDEVKIKTIVEFKKQLSDITPDSTKTNRKSVLPQENYKKMQSLVKNISSFLEGSDETLSNLSEIMSTNLHMYEHSINVMVMSIMIAEVLGFTGDKLLEIGTGALLHDVGKLKLGEMFDESREMTDEEIEQFKTHPQVGYDMIQDNWEISSFVKSIVLMHHEYLDGSGYPKGLKKDGLGKHLHVKIVTVANMFDKLVNNPILKDRIPVYEALEILSSRVHTEIDLEVFEALVTKIEPFPPGTGVILNTEERAIVIKSNPLEPTRPVVKLLMDKNGTMYRNFDNVDLMEALTVFVIDTDPLSYTVEEY